MVTATGRSSIPQPPTQPSVGGVQGGVKFQPAPAFSAALVQLSNRFSTLKTTDIEKIGKDGFNASQDYKGTYTQESINEALALYPKINTVKSDISVYNSNSAFLNACNLLLSHFKTGADGFANPAERRAAWSAVATGAEFIINQLKLDPNFKSNPFSAGLIKSFQNLQESAGKLALNLDDAIAASYVQSAATHLGIDSGNGYTSFSPDAFLSKVYTEAYNSAQAAANDIDTIAGGKSSVIDGTFNSSLITDATSLEKQLEKSDKVTP